MRPAFILAVSLVASPAAGEFSLALPIDCVLDQTCHIQQFVDHDPTDQSSDFMCGSLTYDGHKGTDFALSSLAALTDNVAVLAAAPGRVVGVRDGMADVLQTGPDAPDVSDRECGNGVVIRHDGGWETQYCHLAQGSVTVVQNQTVTAGQTLGMVGLSGQTQFPHLHLSLRKDGDVVDPFVPNGRVSCLEPVQDTLWQSAIPTPSGGLIAVGFADAVPAFDAIKAGTAHQSSVSSDTPLVIWGYAFGGQAGDILTLTIDGPGGNVITETVTLERTQAQLFRAVGRRAPNGGWSPGQYTGRVLHSRAGTVLDQQITETTVP